jgi:hypothetical protein
VRPIQAARHQLTRGRPVEYDGRLGAVSSRLGEHFARDGQWHQPAQYRGPVLAADDRAVARHEHYRKAEPFGDRPREGEAAAGDERDLDASVERGGDRAAILRGDIAGTVEQRAVDVDRDQADRAHSPLTRFEKAAYAPGLRISHHTMNSRTTASMPAAAVVSFVVSRTLGTRSPTRSQTNSSSRPLWKNSSLWSTPLVMKEATISQYVRTMR